MGAFDTIQSALDQYGLGSLAQWAWGRFQEGATLDQIMLEVYQRPEFKAEYPEYETLAQKGRAYSVAELQAYRKAVTGIARQFGISDQFLTRDTMSSLAAGEVSVAEFSQRVADAADAVYRTSPLVRDEFQRMYGVGQGDLIAYFLDPEKAQPIIHQNFVASQVGAASRQSGYGLLTQDEAQRLAQQGVDPQAAQQGFTDLAQNRELFGAIDSGEQDISRDTQLGAAFDANAQDRQEIERRRSRRLAEFSEGGGFATTRQGMVGI